MIKYTLSKREAEANPQYPQYPYYPAYAARHYGAYGPPYDIWG